MKYRYGIIDTIDNRIKLVISFDNIDDAKKELHTVRAKRYATDTDGYISPLRMIEYDRLGHDNNYNLIKYQVIA